MQDASTKSAGESKKGTKMAAKWSPPRRAVWSEPFPPLRGLFWNGPQAVMGAPLLGAAQRTLDGEDRSGMITEEGKAGRTFGEKWSAILVPSPAASNRSRPIALGSQMGAGCRLGRRASSGEFVGNMRGSGLGLSREAVEFGARWNRRNFVPPLAAVMNEWATDLAWTQPRGESDPELLLRERL